MEKQLDELKKILDNSLYHGKSLSEKSRQSVYKRINEKKNRSIISFRWSYIITLPAVGVLLFLLVQPILSEKLTVDQLNSGNSANNFVNNEMVNESLLSEEKPISLLITRENNEAISSSIVLALSPKKQDKKLVDIPFFLNMSINEDKILTINDSYENGGFKGIREDVQQFYNIPINHHIHITDKELVELINSIDGVDVTNPFEFSYEGEDFSEGDLHLKGQDAILYGEMRKDDPRGELGSIERKNEVLLTVFEKELESNDIINLFKTEINNEEVNILLKSYLNNSRNTDVLEIKGTGRLVNETYFYEIDDKTNYEISDEINNYLFEEVN
ncbi:LCP family protein [Salipaludibacillus sp. HK11]|uniref:LCP family glycopolymer transferase n=1 Tax=Salipaludibacillus sp. HK11 TaxID=3394320 RepID=UPI0039FCFA68